MTMSTTTPAAPPPHTALRVGLIVIAALETLSTISDFSGIFYDYQHETRLLQFAQGATSVKLALAPFIAGAALVFAVMGRLRHAIVALAALVLLGWLSELPSIAIHGLEWSLDLAGVIIFAQRFIYPLLAAAAIALAVRNRRLALAGVLISLPTIVFWSLALTFLINVMIYGF